MLNEAEHLLSKSTIMAKLLQLLIGLGVSAALIVWMVGKVDVSAVQAHISQIEWWWLLPCFLLVLVQNYVRAYRWRYLLPPEKVPPTLLLFDALMVGNLTTYFLPFRAGEFIRPALLAARSPIPFATAMASVVIERLFDLVIVLLSLSVLATQGVTLEGWMLRGVQILSVVAVVLAASVAVLILHPKPLERLVRFATNLVAGVLPQKLGLFLQRIVTKIFEEVASEIAAVARGQNLMVITALTMLAWGLTALFFQTAGYLFGDVPLPFGLWMTVVVSLAVAAPSAPGFIGVYQTACLAVYVLLGLSQEVGVAYGVVTHLFQYAVVVLVGGWSLVRNGLSFKDLVSRRVVEKG